MDSISIMQLRFLTLLALLAMAGCATNDIKVTRADSPESKVPGMHPAWERDRHGERHRRNKDGSCRKRGCDNGKLIFNPGETEPSVLDIHRGW